LKYIAFILFVALVVLGAMWVMSLPKVGDSCSPENSTKFHSTGKIVVCEGGKWILRSGTPPR
jgi:hypothetical protein